MTPAVWALLLQLVEAGLAAAPELIADVKKIVAAVEGKSTGSTTDPLGPQVADDTAALENQLKGGK